jgi:hypothetical protein
MVTVTGITNTSQEKPPPGIVGRNVLLCACVDFIDYASDASDIHEMGSE